MLGVYPHLLPQTSALGFKPSQTATPGGLSSLGTVAGTTPVRGNKDCFGQHENEDVSRGGEVRVGYGSTRLGQGCRLGTARRTAPRIRAVVKAFDQKAADGAGLKLVFEQILLRHGP